MQYCASKQRHAWYIQPISIQNISQFIEADSCQVSTIKRFQ